MAYEILVPRSEYDMLLQTEKFVNDNLSGSSLRIRETDLDGWAYHSLIVLNPDDTIKRINDVIEEERRELHYYRDKYFKLKNHKRNILQIIFGLNKFTDE